MSTIIPPDSTLEEIAITGSEVDSEQVPESELIEQYDGKDGIEEEGHGG
ncbi:hypothetical protein [Methylovorus glucosotrophus]|uniref:Uncharacterized protein n=1 Tax=Methylovorus glucosotrophus (strain SIP3-4) TaxID=582744 RepID=C6XEQ0_METGS|nr:hypothetical protein [Methylovorus glucosotrophus]ACT52107.1 hypothetical protein Msip34_2883 [Methylovorus glucosotrophus SIP3-4]